MTADEKIIEGCIQGKRRSYNSLYKKYSGTMLGLCMRYCRCQAEAEDVMQDGFIKVYKNIGKFKQSGSFEGWIKRIMINTAIDNYQSNLKHHFHSDVDQLDQYINLGDEEEPIPHYKEVGITREKLMTLVQNLPEGYRIVFNMFAIDGYGHKDIATTLGISENTSKTQLMKARRKLKEDVNGILFKTEKSYHTR